MGFQVFPAVIGAETSACGNANVNARCRNRTCGGCQDLTGVAQVPESSFPGLRTSVRSWNRRRSHRARTAFTTIRHFPAGGCFRTMTAGKPGSPSPRIEVAILNFPIPTRSRTLRSSHRCIRQSRTCCSWQKHWDVLRSDNAGDQWNEVSGNLPTDFVFRLMSISTSGKIYVVPITSDSLHYPPEGKLRVIVARPAAANGNRSRKGLPQKDC